MKALSKYEAALAKTLTIDTTFGNGHELRPALTAVDDLPIRFPIEAMTLYLQFLITATHLELKDYKSTQQAANVALKIIPQFEPDSKEAQDDWWDFARQYHQAVYDLKTLALEKLGKMREAIMCRREARS